jgi:hypothetical protein
MNKKVLAKLAAFPAFLLATASASFAATVPPTTAVELADAVSLADAQGGAMLIIKSLIVMGLVLWGARLVLSHFKPKA